MMGIFLLLLEQKNKERSKQKFGSKLLQKRRLFYKAILTTEIWTYLSSFIAICKGSVSPSSSTMTGAHMLLKQDIRINIYLSDQNSSILLRRWVKKKRTKDVARFLISHDGTWEFLSRFSACTKLPGRNHGLNLGELICKCLHTQSIGH